MSGSPEPGAWLRRQREARFWSRTEMARRLIKAAEASGDMTMPSADDVAHNIYRWERGIVSPGERYRLYYCDAWGIPPERFGPSGEASPQRHADARCPWEGTAQDAGMVVITITLPEGQIPV